MRLRAHAHPISRGFTGRRCLHSVKDGRWFALNNDNHSYVVDVQGGATADNTPVLSWKWNGGDNQIWRAEIVAP
jgi:Ricin-type beta-trefoil lectin domain-like